MTFHRFSLMLLRPGVTLMRRLPLRFKLMLLGLLMLPLLACLLTSMAFDVQARIAAARAEQAGAALLRQGTELMTLLQLQRAAAAQPDASAGEASVARDTQRALMRQGLERMDAAVAQAPRLALSEPWRAERARLLALPDSGARSPANALQAAFDERSASLRQLAWLIAERSQLLLDPEPATHYLMDLGVNQTMAWLDAAGRLTERAVALSGSGADAPDAGALRPLAEKLQRARADATWRVQGLARAGVGDGHLGRADEASLRLVDLAGKRADGVPLPSLGAAGTEAVEAIGRQGDDHWELFDDLVDARVQALQRQFLLACAFLLVGLVGVGYLVVCFDLTFMGSMGMVEGTVNAVAAGDLSCAVAVRGQDELAAIGTQLDRMSEKLSTMVGETRSSAVRVGQAGATLAENGRALQQRTEVQAASLQQTLATTQQLRAAVAANAQAATALQALTENVRANATQGDDAMATTVQAMGLLNDSVLRVAEVNAVIDDIAFQTNLLALNASVEAARAGESGRGFAVVAGEIRQLAGRCSEAASEVRHLIEATTEQADVSKACIDDASKHLQSIVSGIDEVSQRLSAVATASAEQSLALTQVTDSVSSLDAITRQNAAMAETSAAAAQALSSQAELLRESVATVKLRRGSADEARALVERAMAHLAEVGWSRAAAAFNDPTGSFVDRDLTLFAFDRGGHYLVMGQRPEFVGRALHDMPHLPVAMAESFLKAARSAAAGGGGWIDYESVEPDTHQPSLKNAYIAALDEGSFIGCAVSRDAEAAVGEAAGRAERAGLALAVA